MSGIVEHIVIGAEKQAELQYVPQVRAVPGKGLEGDRYFDQVGSFNRAPLDQEMRELTLISMEAIEVCNALLQSNLEPWQLRRNLVTRGVDLNTLAGKTFDVGEVKLEGLQLCHPCGLLQRLTEVDVLQGLKNRGGLRARIVTEGIIHVGDAIRES